MTTPTHLLIAVVVTAGLAGAEPDQPAGRVLVLDNERTLDGEIDKQGNQYRVKRAAGETLVPADKVLRVCADHEEAYRYLRGRANLDDADERLRLATWCQQNGLRKQALDEARSAVALAPSHRQAKQLLRSLERAEQPTTAPAAKPAPAAIAPTLALSNEALAAFATKVQPVLMNACANCHAAGREGTFKLVRAFEGGLANRKTVQHNVTAVLAQVNTERPEMSPFLLKAVGAHGELGQPPLKGRQAPAYKLLESWVQATLANNPQLRDRGTETKAAERPAFAAPAGVKEETRPPEKPAKAVPADAYDPDAFNRQAHPEKRKESSK